MAIRGYYLGCPGWGLKSWVGRLFPTGTKHADFLARYAEVFNTVEGNTTFYALPTPDMVVRWREQVPDTFRFCFKFPRTITHGKLLIDAAEDVTTFLERVAPLEHKLGTLMLQLPPRFGPEHADRLRQFLAQLPTAFRYAVELRHDLFFAGGIEEDEIVELLRERHVDIVMMDARGLHSGHSLAQADVRARKPNLPVVMRATASRPIVRCVPHEVFADGRHFVERWAPQLARWIADGKQPYFFMHAPDDTYAPENAYAFHAMLRAHADVGELPPWPRAARQMGLFDT
ncbi:MAG TPA: DUF72 domain-containing protein [Kofleriaceae bacterium]|nr:DUF72 domain-containing protein [Kofleriaceae bacterium]